MLDERGATAPYAQLPVTLRVEGDAELVGPGVITAEGGMCGCYVRTIAKSGRAVLTVSTEQTGPVTVEFTIEKR